MSKFERSIVSIIDPTIKLDRLSQPDEGSEESRSTENGATPDGVNPKDSSRWGAYIPLIVINTHRFTEDQIEYMSMSIGDKIPSISIAIKDENHNFAIDTPMDGDVISLYLRPPDIENQKPIRIDFDIVDISSDPSTLVFGLNGIMKIPKFFAEVCKSFGKGTSFDHLQSVCEDIGLGFASNETATDDTMTRFCPYDTYECFVNDTISHTYKDDDSFFNWYIDPYYYLCLVNLNKQFDLEDKYDDVNISTTTPLSGGVNDEKAKDTIKGNLVLTNRSDRLGTNIFIESWSMQNKSAAVWIKNGYKRYSQYLDIDNENKTEYISNFVDPHTTAGSEKDFIIQKGRANDGFYKDQVKYKWLGKQSISNVHDNYIFSEILNFQNLQEIQKLSLNVELSGMNFYIYKYMKIPLEIYESGGSNKFNIAKLKNRDKELGESDGFDKQAKQEDLQGGRSSEGYPMTKEGFGSDQRDQVLNSHISGSYLVNSIKYTYTKPGPVKMSLNLIRREWPIPAKINEM